MNGSGPPVRLFTYSPPHSTAQAATCMLVTDRARPQ